jgi:DNA polymerase-3 subunit delta'
MRFSEVVGHAGIKNRLVRTVKDSRISHAQLFLGPGGSGKLALAIAYAQYINCRNRQGNDACGLCPSCVKYNKLAHPDLHFLYPTARTDKIEKPVSSDFVKEWREVLIANDHYITPADWYVHINIERKQAIINARDCNSLIHTLSYKNYEADYKVMIIWMAERLYHAAAPKILKILEEPPEKTLFILVAEDTEAILPTILSRCQLVRIPPIDHDSLLEHLLEGGINPQTANDALRVHPGDYIKIRKMIRDTGDEDRNFELFRNWMRLCFQGKMEEIIRFVAEMVKNSRDFQKSFLAYGLRMARETFLVNRGSQELTRMNGKEGEFVRNFNPFINARNIHLFSEEINAGIHHIERNVNSSVLFLDLSLKFMVYLKM